MNPIGISTGAWQDHNWRGALEAAMQRGLTAIELSALRLQEFHELTEAISSLDLSAFQHVSLHLPVGLSPAEQESVASRLRSCVLDRLLLVAHPDTVSNYAVWQSFGSRLMLENMDARKDAGRTLIELRTLLEALPSASVCLDLAHAKQIDPTMELAASIAKTFRDRIRQLHVSDIDSNGKHRRLSWSTIRLFQRVATLLQGIPTILESPLDATTLDNEVQAAGAIWEAQPQLFSPAIYISSKIKHADRWRNLRAHGWNIVSSWIDQPAVDDADLLAHMWSRFVVECRMADFVVVYREEGEQLKGALIEVGAALAGGAEVIIVGDIPELGTSHYHPAVRRAQSVEQAFDWLQSRTRQAATPLNRKADNCGRSE